MQIGYASVGGPVTYAKSRYEYGDLVGTLRGLRRLAHRGGVGRRDDGAVISHGECLGVYIKGGEGNEREKKRVWMGKGITERA